MSFSCGSVYNLDSNTNPMCNLISPEELERGCYTLVFLLHRQFHNMFITFLFKENVLHFNGAICSYLLFPYPIQRIRNYKICTRRYKFVALMQIRQIAVVVGKETPRLAITLNRNLTTGLKIIYSLFMVWTVKRVHRGSI